MKIEFLTMDDPLYVLPFFDEFFRHYGRDFGITNVWLCRTMGKRSRSQLAREMLGLYRPFGFIKLASRLAWYRAIGKVPKKENAPQFYSFAQLCEAYGVPYANIGNPNDTAFVEGMKQRSPDVLVSVACPYILKSALLGVPPRGCVNIHHAPLPRYKGMMPTFWQMYHGEKRAGVTVHYMVPKVDEGSALLQDSLEIQPGESLDQLIRRSKRHGAHCMARVLKEIEQSTAVAVPLDNSQGSYFTFPTFTQMREFHRKGLKAI